MDEFFDGWLSMPAITGFLADGIQTDNDQESVLAVRIERAHSTANESTSFASRDAEDQDTSPVVTFTGTCVEARPHGAATPSTISPTTTNLAARQRRGHTKSRLGCLQCKKRKVKCQETLPACANCTKRGSICRYPPLPKYRQCELAIPEAPSPREIVRLSASPITYSAKDMQLFHHYLTVAHPFIPRHYSDVWIKYVPGYSQQYPWIMNAMLAIAGSHLDVVTNSPSTALALSHRQKALNGLNEALTRWPPSADEAHIMLAASYLLSFQSSFLTDGFLDHVLSLRGCATLSQLIMTHEMVGSFITEGTLHAKIMQDTWSHFVHIDQDIALESLVSIRDLGRLVATTDAHVLERTMLVQLVNTLRPLLQAEPASQRHIVRIPTISEREAMFVPATRVTTPYGTWKPVLNPFTSMDPLTTFEDIDWENILNPLDVVNPVKSFNALMSTMTILATWPQEEIMHLFDTSNQLGQIILAHFCAVRFIITPMTAPSEAIQMPARAVVEWIAQIISRLLSDDSFERRDLIKWPEKILRCMQANVAINPALTFMDMRDMIINDPGAFLEGRAMRSSRMKKHDPPKKCLDDGRFRNWMGCSTKA